MRTGDPELMRDINRFHVLDTIRRREPVTRQHLSNSTGLSRITVGAILSDLLAEGLVLESPAAVSSLGRGRPHALLHMNPSAAFAVGAKISLNGVSIAVTNLKAEPLAHRHCALDRRISDPAGLAALLAAAIRGAVKDAGLSPRDIVGVGVGIPGFIDIAQGVSHWNPLIGLGRVPFATMLEEALRLKVVIENDANLVAMAERWFGLGREVDDFAVVTMEAGIGMGAYIGGALHRGHHNMGTEFGHTKMVLEHGAPCRCGQTGCLEAYAAPYAILRAAGEDEGDDKALRRIADAARSGDPALGAIFSHAGHVLGVGVANILNLFDPARLILSGSSVHCADLLLPSLQVALQDNVHRGLSGRCEVTVSPWDDHVWTRAAAALLLETLYRLPYGSGRGALRFQDGLLISS